MRLRALFSSLRPKPHPEERLPATKDLGSLLEELPRARQAAADMREIILSNLAMIGEVPAPTFREERRVGVWLQRLGEFGLQNCSTDEMHNGFGILPGESGGQNILLVANADTLAEEEEQPAIGIDSDHVRGPFVGDNSPALAAIASIPALLEKLKLRLKSNLILMAAARSLGRGNLEGLKFFLANSALPIHYGLCLESVQLGRLNYTCLGMLRGDIICRLPENYDWASFGSAGTIIPINDVISRINRIPLPRRPLTRIIMGSIHGGISYQNIARQTVLSFEVRSESDKILSQIEQQIEDITEHVSAHAGVQMKMDIFARRAPGGIEISHPLVRNARTIMTTLGIQPMLYPTTSAAAVLIEKNIPAVTIGFTTGERRDDLAEIEELVSVGAMPDGLAQILTILLAIDRGLGRE